MSIWEKTLGQTQTHSGEIMSLRREWKPLWVLPEELVKVAKGFPAESAATCTQISGKRGDEILKDA